MGFKNWETPKDFYEEYNREYNFTLDAAASSNNTLCYTYCTELGTFNMKGELVSEADGLNYDWTGHRVWCNPPYEGLYQWVEKAAKFEADVTVMLLPPSIDTKWFHTFIWDKRYNAPRVHWGRGSIRVNFLEGRLRFNINGKPGLAPRAGNMVVVFYKRKK